MNCRRNCPPTWSSCLDGLALPVWRDKHAAPAVMMVRAHSASARPVVRVTKVLRNVAVQPADATAGDLRPGTFHGLPSVGIASSPWPRGILVDPERRGHIPRSPCAGQTLGTDRQMGSRVSRSFLTGPDPVVESPLQAPPAWCRAWVSLISLGSATGPRSPVSP